MIKNKMLSIIILTTLILSIFSLGIGHANAQATGPEVVVIQLNGPLTPVWSSIIQRGIDRATAVNAQLLVIELNTPGGGVDLMNQLIQKILASPIPVAMYVFPNGSMAASAGTLLVLSGQISAMSPLSVIGAASPVGLQGENIPTTEELKVKEILKASARSLASRRGEAAVTLAESAIDSAKAASASEALSAGLVDVVATDLQDLMRQLDGRTINFKGTDRVLDLKFAQVIPANSTFIEDVLGMLTNPNIVFVLLSIGVQAILIELSHPGGWVLGFVGVVMLSLAVFGLGILPVNWFGGVFLIMAFVLFVLDIKAPTHGALTVVGTGSFIAGSLILFNSAHVPGFSNVSVPLVVGMGVFLGLSFFAVVMIAVRAMKTPIITGRETMAGKEGYAVSEINPTGIVQVAGERWSALIAHNEKIIHEKEKVIVEAVEGLKLVVKKK